MGERVKKERPCLGTRVYMLHAHGVCTGGKGNRPPGLRASGLGAMKESLLWAYMQLGLVVEVGLNWWVLGLDLGPA